MAFGSGQAGLSVLSGSQKPIIQTQGVGLAQPMGEYSPEVQAEIARQERRRQIANVLLQQGMRGGPAVAPAGRFVAPVAWQQGIGNIAQMLAGLYGNYRADEASQEAIDKENTAYEKAIRGYQKRIGGTPAVPTQAGAVGTSEDENAPPTMGTPAVPVTPEQRQAAITEALMSSRIPAVQRYGLMQQQTLDAATAREDVQQARAAEQQAAREQRTHEQQMLLAEREAARKATDVRERELQKQRLEDQAALQKQLKGMETASAEKIASMQAGLKTGEQPGTPQYRVNKDKSSRDYNTLKTGQSAVDWSLSRINKLVDPKNAEAFSNLYGGLTAYVTREKPSDAVQNIRNTLDELRQQFKAQGTQIMRLGGSPGQITEREWPIMENLIAKLDNPRISVQEAQTVLGEVKQRMENMRTQMQEVYDMEWGGSQFYQKPKGAAAVPAASPTIAPPAATTTQQAAQPLSQAEYDELETLRKRFGKQDQQR